MAALVGWLVIYLHISKVALKLPCAQSVCTRVHISARAELYFCTFWSHLKICAPNILLPMLEAYIVLQSNDRFPFSWFLLDLLAQLLALISDWEREKTQNLVYYGQRLGWERETRASSISGNVFFLFFCLSLHWCVNVFTRNLKASDAAPMGWSIRVVSLLLEGQQTRNSSRDPSIIQRSRVRSKTSVRIHTVLSLSLSLSHSFNNLNL